MLKKGKKQENPSFFWPFPSAFPELLREGTELNFPIFFRPFPGIKNDRGREQSPGAFVERELRVTENHSGNVGTKTWPGKAPEAKIPGKKKRDFDCSCLFRREKYPGFWECWIFLGLGEYRDLLELMLLRLSVE